MRKTVMLFSAILVLSLVTHVHAALINGGFEEGDFTGWTISARDVTRYFLGGSASPPLPQEGDYFAGLASDVSPWTELSQVVGMQPGDTLSGWAYWDKWITTEQEAYVRIYQGGNLMAIPWIKNDVTGGSSGWEAWSFTASYAADYTLILGIREPNISTFHSQVYFDGNDLRAVPLPGAVLLLGSGLLSLAALGRKLRFQ